MRDQQRLQSTVEGGVGRGGEILAICGLSRSKRHSIRGATRTPAQWAYSFSFIFSRGCTR